jgi:hypothetical protein
MDAPRPPGGAPALRAPHSPAPEPQRKSRQQSLFSFFRQASREEVEEQAAERMEVIDFAVAEAKAAAAGAPPKRAPGRPRKAPVLVLGRHCRRCPLHYHRRPMARPGST